MAVDHLHLIVIHALLSQVIPSYGQYVQYAGTPYPVPAYISSYPVQSYAPSPTPVYAQQYSPTKYEPATNLQPVKTPSKPVAASASYATGPSTPVVPIPANAVTPSIYQPTAYQAVSIQQPVKAAAVTPPSPEPPMVQPIQPPPCITKEISQRIPSLPKDFLSKASPPFDTNILNNLAIALQLLIVSNLIHNPPPESNPVREIIDEELFPAIVPLPIAHIPPTLPDPVSYSNQFIPNANFLGTSSFGDTGITKSMMSSFGSPTIPSPRPMRLMSPYDAIGPNSPYMDSFQAKPELKSPYHLASDYKDLFSLSELFKI